MFLQFSNHLPGLSWLLVLSTGRVAKQEARTRDKREGGQIEMCVLLSVKAGWEGEEAGKRVRPGRKESQGHGGAGADENRGKV